MIFSAIRVLAPISRSWATVSSNDDRRSRLDGSGILGQAPTSWGGGVLLRLARSLAGSCFRSGASGWSRCGSAEQTVWRQRYNLSANFPIFKQLCQTATEYIFVLILALPSALFISHRKKTANARRSVAVVKTLRRDQVNAAQVELFLYALKSPIEHVSQVETQTV